MARTQIAEFEVGRPVEGMFAVVRKSRRANRNGDPYLVLELSDSTGRIEGRVWNNADYFDRNIQTGDTVIAVGRPTMFRDVLQLDIRRLDRAEGEFDEAFVPMATRALDELAGELDFLLDEIVHPELHALACAIWRGPRRERLLRSPATVADHHSYVGGLVEHTVAVASLCLAAADRHDTIDRQLLLAAALLHDIGRAAEIEVGSSISLDDAGALTGHVLLAHEALLDAARPAGSPGGRTDGVTPKFEWWAALMHAIANHHGPVDRCRTREAVTLAMANALDVRLSD